MLERTDDITNEVLEPITFVLAYPIVYSEPWSQSTAAVLARGLYNKSVYTEYLNLQGINTVPLSCHHFCYCSHIKTSVSSTIHKAEFPTA